jgi:hypothetical protein
LILFFCTVDADVQQVNLLTAMLRRITARLDLAQLCQAKQRSLNTAVASNFAQQLPKSDSLPNKFNC